MMVVTAHLSAQLTVVWICGAMEVLMPMVVKCPPPALQWKVHLERMGTLAQAFAQ